MAQQDTSNVANLESEYFLARIQIMTRQHSSWQCEYQEVAKIRVVNHTYQLCRDLADGCAMVLEYVSLNGVVWHRSQEVRSVAVVWEPSSLVVGGPMTVIHDQNVENVLELVRQRNGVDVVSILI